LTPGLQILQKSQRSNSWSDSFLTESPSPSPTISVSGDISLAAASFARQMSPLKRHFEELVVDTSDKAAI
jgi:hypothetical protein